MRVRDSKCWIIYLFKKSLTEKTIVEEKEQARLFNCNLTDCLSKRFHLLYLEIVSRQLTYNNLFSVCINLQKCSLKNCYPATSNDYSFPHSLAYHHMSDSIINTCFFVSYLHPIPKPSTIPPPHPHDPTPTPSRTPIRRQ